jgi:isopentenyldiphosphate isomerase
MFMELLDIIDTDGNVTNKTEDRKIVHQNGLLHHASGVIFVREENNEYELLSQQRSFKKEKNAGLWDLSASGHVPSGQSPIKSLVREIKEELGLSVKENELSLLGKFWRNEIHKENFIENELIYIYM